MIIQIQIMPKFIDRLHFGIMSKKADSMLDFLRNILLEIFGWFLFQLMNIEIFLE